MLHWPLPVVCNILDGVLSDFKGQEVAAGSKLIETEVAMVGFFPAIALLIVVCMCIKIIS
jgi:hypothetical protein